MTIDEAIDCVLIEAVLTGVVTDVEAVAADLRTIFAHNGGELVYKRYDYSITRTDQYYCWRGQETPMRYFAPWLQYMVKRVLEQAGMKFTGGSGGMRIIISWSPREDS